MMSRIWLIASCVSLATTWRTWTMVDDVPVEITTAAATAAVNSNATANSPTSRRSTRRRRR